MSHTETCRIIFPYMVDDLTVAEAAEALGTSVQTVRALLRKGELAGRQEPRGTRHTWVTSRKGVDAFLSKNGRLDGRRRRRPSRVTQLEDKVDQLQQQVAHLSGTPASRTSPEAARVAAERDNLRARVVALEEALAHTRHAAELQRRADEERAGLVEHLLAATVAAERTDALRREALAVLDKAVAEFSRPGHPGLG
jgi:excisionase family DNA binding protein